MTLSARLSLAAPRGHALAEAVRLAFEARGTDLPIVPVQGPVTVADGDVRLTLRRGAEPPVILRDAVAMLELSEDLHPDQPFHPRDPVRRAEHREALLSLPRFGALLDQLTGTADPRDVDLKVHLLRDRISLLSPLLAGGRGPDRPFSLLDLASLPLLWRIDLLDHQFGTNLLVGFEALRDRLTWQLRHSQVAALLDEGLCREWLGAIEARGAFITQTGESPNWEASFGPVGRAPWPQEKKLPTSLPKTKVRSIGSPDSIR